MTPVRQTNRDPTGARDRASTARPQPTDDLYVGDGSGPILPKTSFPEEESDPRPIHELIHDDLMLDTSRWTRECRRPSFGSA